MDLPIITTTIQACILSAVSNAMAQGMTSYRTDTPYTLDYQPILSFVLFTALSNPPNYLWQNLLESLFPGKYLSPASSAISAASANNEKELDAEEKEHSIVEPRLNVTNTIIKFVLDQTIGAVVNTVMFIAFFAGLKGLNIEQVGQVVQQDFSGMIRAGWKLWPIVSMAQFTLVPVEKRMLVGSLAGMAWNIYLSLVASGN